LKLAYVDNIGKIHTNHMQSKSSKCHHFTNFNARVRVTVCL